MSHGSHSSGIIIIFSEAMNFSSSCLCGTKMGISYSFILIYLIKGVISLDK